MWSEREIKYFQRNGVDIANGFGLENVWNWRLVNWVERQIEGWMWCKWQWKIRYKYIFEITFSVAHKTCTDNAKILSKCKAAKCNFWLFVIYLFCSFSSSLHHMTTRSHFISVPFRNLHVNFHRMFFASFLRVAVVIVFWTFSKWRHGAAFCWFPIHFRCCTPNSFPRVCLFFFVNHQSQNLFEFKFEVSNGYNWTPIRRGIPLILHMNENTQRTVSVWLAMELMSATRSRNKEVI